MKIIISPAKQMTVDTDTLAWLELPLFLPQAQRLARTMRDMSYEQLKTLWKCNDQIAALNVKRLDDMDLQRNLTPAILAYKGIQYQYMAPGVFTQQEYDYLQRHLRILSGFYGVLKPLDGVTPYRLEMQAKLSVDHHKDLYGYWGNQLAHTLADGTRYIINLASKEYSVAVSRHLPTTIPLITCVFGEEREGKVVEKGTACKMARGEMVRFLATHQITEPEQLSGFNRLNYHFDAARSDENTFIFIRCDHKL